jgi:hypothetical protein
MIHVYVRIASRIVLPAFAILLNTLPAIGAFPSHTFDTGNQGWTIVGANTDYGPPTEGINGDFGAGWDSRGNPGGALSLTDHYYATWISAPAPFLGDQSDMYGQSFSYDIFIRYSDATSFPYPTAAIQSGDLTLLYTIATPPLFTWDTRVVTFDPNLWTVGEGIGTPGSPPPVATAAQMQSVLGNLEELFLLTEWRTGLDDTSVDNIGVGFDLGLQGDYNHDGVVDAADYVVWRRHLGSVYSQTDFAIWRANFSETAGEGGSALGAPSQTSVPEPASAISLLAVALFGCWLRCRTTDRAAVG